MHSKLWCSAERFQYEDKYCGVPFCALKIENLHYLEYAIQNIVKIRVRYVYNLPLDGSNYLPLFVKI